MVAGDASELPFIKNSFDLVISLLCLHLLPNLKDVLSSIFRILKPRGSFFFVFFGEDEYCKRLLQNVLPNIVTKVHSPEHGEIIRNVLFIGHSGSTYWTKKGSEKGIFLKISYFYSYNWPLFSDNSKNLNSNHQNSI